jgi:hypothetical protein
MRCAPEKKIVIGSEGDERLRWMLDDVLLRMGGKPFMHECASGGPRELERVGVEVRSGRVIIDAETSVGLSLHGPSDLVEEIHGMVKYRLSKRLL